MNKLFDFCVFSLFLIFNTILSRMLICSYSSFIHRNRWRHKLGQYLIHTCNIIVLILYSKLIWQISYYWRFWILFNRNSWLLGATLYACWHRRRGRTGPPCTFGCVVLCVVAYQCLTKSWLRRTFSDDNCRQGFSGADWLFKPALWLSRQTGPMGSGVTINSGDLHKYPNRAILP